MAPTMFGGAEFLVLALYYLGIGLPLGIPPGPEDPLMARVAPEDCLYYTAWSGMSLPDGRSGNQTEQLLAEPEVLRLLVELDKRFTEGFAKLAKEADNPAEKIMAELAPKWGKLLIMRPAAFYVTKLEYRGEDLPPNIEGGGVMATGEETSAIHDKLVELQAKFLEGKFKEVDIGGITCYQIRFDEKTPVVTWGTRGNYLLIGLGDKAMEGIFANVRRKEPATWLVEAKAKLPVDRVGTVTYANFAPITAMALAQADEETKTIISELGLTNISTYMSVSGLDKEGYVSRTLIGTKGELGGVLKLANAKPLTAADVASVPKDATFASLFKLDADQALTIGLDIAKKIQPAEAEEFERNLAAAKDHFGFDPRADLLQALGDTWTVYNSPSEGGFLVTGLTATVSVRDYAKMRKTHDQLVAMARAALSDRPAPGPMLDPAEFGPDIFVVPKKEVPAEEAPMAETVDDLFADPDADEGEELEEETDFEIREAVGGEAALEAAEAAEEAAEAEFDGEDFEFAGPVGPQIKEINFQGKKIYYVTGIVMGMPFAPSWCLTEKQLIVALFPQNVQAVLSRDESFASLAEVPEVKGLLEAEDGPQMLGYADTKSLFEMFYPFVQMSAQSGFSTLDAFGEGMGLDVSILPGTKTISRHLRPNVTAISRRADGLEIVAKQSLPGGGTSTTAPVMVALLLPAVQAAREAAQRNGSLNNLRQIALAMLNFESATRRFPAAARMTKEGKPGLSWRVAILPYIEETHLYREFKLDEPWDSEHNIKLLEKMPPSLRSPKSKAPAGHTTYLAIRGENSIIAEAEKGISMREVTDGLSNTILVVEANDDHAVPWTKPDDYEVDEMDPLAGLGDVWAGKVFLAVFADGRAQAIDKSADPKKILALFTRSGGEAVRAWDLDEDADETIVEEAVIEEEAGPFIPDEAPAEIMEEEAEEAPAEPAKPFVPTDDDKALFPEEEFEAAPSP